MKAIYMFTFLKIRVVLSSPDACEIYRGFCYIANSVQYDRLGFEICLVTNSVLCDS
jgi:hypothetical protein